MFAGALLRSALLPCQFVSSAPSRFGMTSGHRCVRSLSNGDGRSGNVLTVQVPAARQQVEVADQTDYLLESRYLQALDRQVAFLRQGALYYQAMEDRKELRFLVHYSMLKFPSSYDFLCKSAIAFLTG